MVEVYYIVSLVTSGMSLTLGVISLAFGIRQKNGKEYLIFGILSLCLAIFFLLPPIGFIVHDVAPYSHQILVKRIFIYGFYALMPFFFISYSGYKKNWVAYLILILAVIDYLFMMTTKEDARTPFWFMISLTIFFLIAVFGIYSGIWQWKNGNKKDAHLLLFSMSIYTILFVFNVIHQFYSAYTPSSGESKFFLPQHLIAIVFSIIMGFRLFERTYEKFKFERMLQIRKLHWNEFMRKAPLIVLELDKTGNILFINEFGLNHLGYGSLDELNGKNWFDHFIPIQDQKTIKNIFNVIVEEKRKDPYHKTFILRKDRQKVKISWVNYLIDSDDSQSKTLMWVGKDVTEDETNSEMVKTLKLELEKEKFSLLDINTLMMEEFVGKSPAFQYVLHKVSTVATTLVPVLMEGETGVGKEVVADLIYRNSSRVNKPFIKVNCGALPKELIEDELFGHEKGAFTSAIQARKGRFELADGGTIFLDEIGELPLEMQPKLLRVLQNGQFERVGGQKTIQVDVRIIAATNRNLEKEIQQGRFRDDLFYRLSVFPITIPPLRKRREDLLDLINYFVTIMSKKYQKNLLQISKANMQRLMEHTWPGNIRELKNVIERSVLASDGDTLKMDWFFNADHGETPEDKQSKSLVNVEKEYIEKMLEESHWKINGENGAAEKLEMHPNTLRSKMKKLHISRPAQIERFS